MGYPTAEELREWFRLHEQGQAAKFFELYVRDDVKWTVMGTNPIAGVYPSKAAFLAGTVGILRKALTDRWDAEVTNVIAGGEQAAIELTVTSEQKNGAPFVNKYVWILKFDENNKVKEGKAFFDSFLVSQAIKDNVKE